MRCRAALVDTLIGAYAPVLGALLLLVAAVAVAAMAAGRRARGYRREIERLKEDVQAIVADPRGTSRIGVGGRSGDVVDIVAGLNQLLERAAEESRAHAERPDYFPILASTVPEVALVHTNAILYANDAAGALFGVAPATLHGKQVTDLMRPAYRAMIRKHIGASLEGDQPIEPVELQLINGGEDGLWVELFSRRLLYEGHNALLSVAKDITHRKSLEASLGRSKLLARVTLESIGEGVITTDRTGTIDYMNEAAEQLIATTRSVAVGKKLPELIALIDEVDRSSLGDPVARCLTERRRVNLGRRALLVAKQSKREFSAELTASPIRGPERELAGCVIIFHDVTEMRGLAREMSYQASHDALTGLVNRAEFERRLELALESTRGDGSGHVVCYLDLDRFKAVNDSCGHLVGDNLLRELAALLKEKVRESDTVARVGGDEFAMLLSGCPLDKARQIADTVVTAVGEYQFTWRDRAFDLGVSMGLVQVGQESASAEAVLTAADSACYIAKQQGRGRVHVYSVRDELLARERGEIQWLQRLQKALKENQFELYVQPIIAVGGRAENGPAAELLLRMRDDSGKSILPGQFLGAAERYQLMSHVDRWVVQTALTAIANGTPHLPEGRTCNINLSGQTLGDEDFLEFVVDLLDRTGVPPAKLCFEVAESAVVNNLGHARRFINVLHGIGCQFALDDFGSGISSFANLKHLSVDYLKIDGTYTRDLERDTVNREMIAAMIKLAKSLDFRVVAEQIEDQASFEAVRDLGIDFVQGYIVERPHPLHQAR